jgi:hypothetical protein
MGKRSDFERIPQDFYPTPLAAIAPLIPYLRGVRSFAEPCCGDGDLVRHFEARGLHCVYSGDIRTGQDALAVDSYGDVDAIITNPPYKREVMHRLILHFQRIAPTWLLLAHDWSATMQAAEYLPSCSDIVVLPRLKWIAGSKHRATDSHAWYRFDLEHHCGPVLHNDRGLSPCVSLAPASLWEEMWSRPYAGGAYQPEPVGTAADSTAGPLPIEW